jgi:cohesin loading factor subunit SCC2
VPFLEFCFASCLEWNNELVSFGRYCSEILALLPFTSPDEPLYLIYTINRVIQVRAGALEAKMKALSMHLSQRYTEKVSYKNGQPELAVHPNFNEMASMDLNGTIQHEPAGQPIFNHMISMDLNESIQLDAADQLVSNHSTSWGAKTRSMGSGVSCVLSEDDLQKVQVALKLN